MSLEAAEALLISKVAEQGQVIFTFIVFSFLLYSAVGTACKYSIKQGKGKDNEIITNIVQPLPHKDKTEVISWRKEQKRSIHVQ